MNRVHVVSAKDRANGMFAVATLLAGERDRVADAAEFASVPLDGIDEVWVHGAWLPCLWRACLRVLGTRGRVRLVRMTHGALSPVPLRRRGRWRKALAAPVERALFARCDRVAVTGEWEAEWFRRYVGAASARFEFVELKRFFALPDLKVPPPPPPHVPLRVLYLGRRHPLKGVEELELAAAESAGAVELRIVGDSFGDAKAAAIDWCDALALPSASENFGLVVAEALERNRRVVVTDAMPAWSSGETYGGRLVCLRDWAAAGRATRVTRLVDCFRALAEGRD